MANRSPYDNVDLDSLDFDFSFDDIEKFDVEAINANENIRGNTTENILAQEMNNRVDYTQLFSTTQIFASKAEIVKYCRSIGKQLNMSLIIGTSKKRIGNKEVFYILCDRSGDYRPRNFKKERVSSTKKCKCPFTLRASDLLDVGWQYVVVQGRHNHDLAIYAEGHMTGKFEEAECRLTSELTKSFMGPNDILSTLKRVTDGNSSIIKHVNNARQKMIFFRKVDCTNILSDIFFLHPESYKMLNAWPYVISLDCTYKTNRYELPLLEVVGFISTWLTFTIAYCFMSSEKEETFVWALKNLRTFFVSSVPIAIITDRELGLIKAVGLIFPESKHMLCRRHIEMAIKSKAIKLSGGSESFARNFVWRWNNAISSHILDEWILKWKQIEDDYASHPTLLSYVEDTWLIPYKEKILSVWVDQFMHFGTYTSNRVESEHHRVKRELKSHVATFDTIFRRLNKVMTLQIDAIKSSLEKSRTKQLIGLSSLFDDIAFHVSHKGIKSMNDEFRRNEEQVHGAELICGCYFQRTHGLPCAHKLDKHDILHQGVSLIEIHPFWKKLDIEMASHDEHIDYNEDMYARVWEDLRSAPPPLRRRLFQNLREGLYPGLVDIKEPDFIQSKGRPKKKLKSRDLSEWEYTKKMYGIATSDSTKPAKKSNRRSSLRSTYIASIQAKAPNSTLKSPVIILDCDKWQSIVSSAYKSNLPPFIIPFIRGFFDVESDGNCGYRALALHLWGDEDRWLQVRQECYSELNRRKELYNRIFGNAYDVETVLDRIKCNNSPAPFDKWMTLPDMLLQRHTTLYWRATEFMVDLHFFLLQ